MNTSEKSTKLIFEEPKADVIVFEAEDVITTSAGEGEDKDQVAGGWE